MRHRKNLAPWQLIVGTGLLAGGLALFGATPSAKADDCQERIVKADHRVHEAVEHHGWESKQTAEARRQLAEARNYCWEHGHRWWDVEGKRWHADRDWDDHDHDHDRDHDHR